MEVHVVFLRFYEGIESADSFSMDFFALGGGDLRNQCAALSFF